MSITNFKFEEDSFTKNVEGFGKIYDEEILLMKFLQTKPQVKNMDINYYDLYYTVVKNRDEKEIVDDQYEKIEKDSITPNHYIGIKPLETILR